MKGLLGPSKHPGNLGRKSWLCSHLETPEGFLDALFKKAAEYFITGCLKQQYINIQNNLNVLEANILNYMSIYATNRVTLLLLLLVLFTTLDAF